MNSIYRSLIGVLALAGMAGPASGQDAPALRLSADGRADTLVATAGRATQLQLALPGNIGWTDAHVGRLVVRTPGRQDDMLSGLDRRRRRLDWTFDRPGTAVILLEAGPPDIRGLSDAWQRTTYCARMIVRVAPPAGKAPAAPDGDPGVLAKAGQKIEIMPLVDPTRMQPGEDMGVRLYFEGDKRTAAAIHITGPGRALTARSDNAGTAHFPIDAAGRWRVRFEHVSDGTTYTADLLFDVTDRQEDKR